MLTIGAVDIINVVSVTSQAQVKQWFEENDEEIQNALYWRQCFDVRTYELSVCIAPLSVIPLMLIPPSGSRSISCAAAIHPGIRTRC